MKPPHWCLYDTVLGPGSWQVCVVELCSGGCSQAERAESEARRFWAPVQRTRAGQRRLGQKRQPSPHRHRPCLAPAPPPAHHQRSYCSLNGITDATMCLLLQCKALYHSAFESNTSGPCTPVRCAPAYDLGKRHEAEASGDGDALANTRTSPAVLKALIGSVWRRGAGRGQQRQRGRPSTAAVITGGCCASGRGGGAPRAYPGAGAGEGPDAARPGRQKRAGLQL